MQRLTITVDDELIAHLDRLIAARGCQNRSEAIRHVRLVGVPSLWPRLSRTPTPSPSKRRESHRHRQTRSRSVSRSNSDLVKEL
jgi:hypothetical protein